MELEQLMQMFYESIHVQEATITIAQYGKWDNYIQSYTGEFKQIFEQIPQFDRYYYRVAALGKHESFQRVYGRHFGVKISSIGKFELSEEGFLNAYLNYMIGTYKKERDTDKARWYNFAYLMEHDFWYIDRMNCLKQNTEDDFNRVLEGALKKYRSFKKIEDLNLLNEVNGIYILVLDRYNACYIGQSNNMKKRIMRHWARNDYFTGAGIDMFKAYDTTRIFAAITAPGKRTNMAERKIISAIPYRYTLNYLAGGDVNQLQAEGKSILKPENTDDSFVDYTKEYYDIAERVKESQARFIVNT